MLLSHLNSIPQTKFTLLKTISVKTAGALEIKGVSSNGQYSTIEMNKFSGFELDENSELNIFKYSN